MGVGATVKGLVCLQIDANCGLVLGYVGIIWMDFAQTFYFWDKGVWVHHLSLQALEYKQSGNTTSSKLLRLLQRMLLWNWKGRRRMIHDLSLSLLRIWCFFQKLAGQKECSNTRGCTLVPGRVDYQPRRVGIHWDVWQDHCPHRLCGFAPGRLFEPYVVASLPLLLQVPRCVKYIYVHVFDTVDVLLFGIASPEYNTRDWWMDSVGTM